ncbi:MAG: DUF1330 domain-containing protein [Gammaproteobacteria bacterium]|nr:DUF1330 domain-containing protein [Gammaproteobacteria bacterium]
MAGYLIVDIAGIHDAKLYERYREQVAPSLQAAGGRYLARGGAIEVLEGDWRPSRIVLVRFDTTRAAREWWASDGYAPIRQMRLDSAQTNMILTEGLAAQPQ